MSVDAELIKECIREVLSERASVDPETHRSHHATLGDLLPELRDFLTYRRARMLQLKKRKDNWEKIKNTAVGALVISTVGGAIYLVGWVGKVFVDVFLHWVHSVPPPGG